MTAIEKALKVIDALNQEANSIARGEIEYIRPFTLGCTVAQLEAWVDQLEAEITRHMTAPSTITETGALLADELCNTVLQFWTLTAHGWVRDNA